MELLKRLGQLCLAKQRHHIFLRKTKIHLLRAGVTHWKATNKEVSQLS